VRRVWGETMLKPDAVTALVIACPSRCIAFSSTWPVRPAGPCPRVKELDGIGSVSTLGSRDARRPRLSGALDLTRHSADRPDPWRAAQERSDVWTSRLFGQSDGLHPLVAWVCASESPSTDGSGRPPSGGRGHPPGAVPRAKMAFRAASQVCGVPVCAKRARCASCCMGVVLYGTDRPDLCRVASGRSGASGSVDW
jgi:hypothetical protein